MKRDAVKFFQVTRSMKFKVGNRVVTKIDMLLRRRGVVTSARRDGRSQRYDILGDDGHHFEATGRDIKLEEVSSVAIESARCSTDSQDSEESSEFLVSGSGDSSEDERPLVVDSLPGQLAGDPHPVESLGDGYNWASAGRLAVDDEPCFGAPAAVVWTAVSPETPSGVIRRPIDYFRRCFPQEHVTHIVRGTNTALGDLGENPSFCKAELDRWMGIQVAMCLERQQCTVASFWKTESDTFDQAPDFGRRTGMTLERFQLVSSAIAFTDRVDEQADPWWDVRQLIESFNDNMTSVVTPGAFLAIDHVHSLWLGKEYIVCHDRLLRFSKEAYGSESESESEFVGHDMAAVADVDTGCILQLELLESKERIAGLKYSDKHPYDTGQILRMCAKWSGSNRVVVAGSAFSSVQSLIAVKKELSLNFMGRVNAIHTGYPRVAIRTWSHDRRAAKKKRRAWIAFRAEYPQQDGEVSVTKTMTALARSVPHERVQMFVSNVASMYQCPVQRLRRCRQNLVIVEGISVGLPAKLDATAPQMTAARVPRSSPTEDIRNQYRDGLLRLRSLWSPSHWQHRLFATVLWVAVTNAFLLYRYEQKSPIQIQSFTNVLLSQLVDLQHAAPEEGSSSTRGAEPTAAVASSSARNQMH